MLVLNICVDLIGDFAVYRKMCMFVAVLSAIYALSYTLAPSLTASLYLPNANADTTVMGRYFAVALWFTAIVCWLLKDSVDQHVHRAIAVAGIASAGLGTITSLLYTINAQMTVLGWGPVVIYLLALIGWLIVFRSNAQSVP